MSSTHLATRALVPACAAALAATCHVAVAQPTRVSIVYDVDPVVRALVYPAAGPGLTPQRTGALRQAPASGGMFTGDDPGLYTVAKVSGTELATLTAPAMAARLRTLIAHGADGARSHLVSVDELGIQYADPRAARPRRGATLPRLRGNLPGVRFAQAMRMIDTPSPYGGTWASRVHVFLAPAVHSSIAAGRGPHRNLGRDGKPHLRSWRGVMPGLARAGGLHLQMYHARGGTRTAFTLGEWRRVPGSFTALLARYGGRGERVHFVFSQAGAPSGMWGCGDAMACTWAAAESTPAGARVLANGPGVYRIGDDAARWLAEYNRRFT